MENSTGLLIETETSTVLPFQNVTTTETAVASTTVKSLVKLTIDDLTWLSADENKIELSNGIEVFRVAREGQAVSLFRPQNTTFSNVMD